jgi:hypothetical protein
MNSKFLLLLLLILLTACETNISISKRLHSIGDYLCCQSIDGKALSLRESREVHDVVMVGNDLPTVLDDMRTELKAGYAIETQEGEPGSIKDERVTIPLLFELRTMQFACG